MAPTKKKKTLESSSYVNQILGIRLGAGRKQFSYDPVVVYESAGDVAVHMFLFFILVFCKFFVWSVTAAIVPIIIRIGGAELVNDKLEIEHQAAWNQVQYPE